MAVRKNLAVDAGTTWVGTVNWTDSGNNPIDTSGYTAVLEVRKPGQLTGNPLHRATVSVGPEAGLFRWKVTDEVTVGWTFDKAAYYLIVESPDGDKYRLMEGLLTVVGGVTA